MHSPLSLSLSLSQLLPTVIIVIAKKRLATFDMFNNSLKYFLIVLMNIPRCRQVPLIRRTD